MRQVFSGVINETTINSINIKLLRPSYSFSQRRMLFRQKDSYLFLVHMKFDKLYIKHYN